MASYTYPGIYVTESLAGPTPEPLTTSPSTAGFMGEHWRGPSTATLCNSWNDFVNYFGGFNTSTTPVLGNPYLAYAVYEFFANGGQAAWVARITSSATPGASASTTLKDEAATPQNTLSLTAGMLGVSGNVGTWGNQLYCDVIDSTVSPGRFTLNIYYGGTTIQYLQEAWVDLSMNKTDSRYAPSILNSPTSGSLWVVAADLGSLTTAPSNCPAGTLGKQFSGGTDSADPSTSDYQSALTFGQEPMTAPFDIVPGVLNFNIPGVTTTAVINQAIQYAQQRPTTFLVIDTPSGQTPAGAVTYLGSLSPVSSYAAVYYPWVTATNPASSQLQSTILLPPGGFILGQYVSSDATAGVWRAPAGATTVLANVVQLERPLSQTDSGSLNGQNVNALQTVPGTSTVRIWGTRTMQQGYASLYVPVRRTLNFIEASITQAIGFAVFQPNNPTLWTTVTAVIDSFLSGLYNQGAFGTATPATAYYVVCDASNNTPSTIAQGVLNINVGVALQYPAEFINLVISQFETGAITVSIAA